MPKTLIGDRPLYRVKADLFKAIAHPARVRILEVLRDGERSVRDLLPEVGIEASHLSQQLAVLRRAQLIKARREGSMVFYSIRDKRTIKLLEVARSILIGSLAETRDLLTDLED